MGEAPSDLRLLLNHNAGDEPAFATLVRRHVDLVHSAARRRCGRDAEDVTQAVFLTLLKRPKQATRAARRPGGLAAWLLATTRNLSNNANRRQRRRDHHERKAGSMHAFTAHHAVASGDPSAALAWSEIAPLLDDAVLALPAADRAAILLKFYENLPAPVIAQRLDISPAAARQRVSRAIAKLRRKLSKRGIEVPAATLASLLAAHATTAAPTTLAATCCALATGGGATAAALTLAKGTTMIPLLLKAAVATTAGTLAVAAGIAGSDGEATSNQATSASTTSSPATFPDTPEPPSEVMAATDVPVPTAEDYLPLGEVVTRVLADGRGQLVDLDTGRQYLVDRSRMRTRMSDGEYFESRGIDGYAFVNPDEENGRIDARDVMLRPAPSSWWDDDHRTLVELEPLRVEGALEARLDNNGDHDMNAYGGLPRTWLFVTREAGAGVLQIVETDQQRGRMKVRYKLLARGLLPKPPEEGREATGTFMGRQAFVRHLTYPPNVAYEGTVPEPRRTISTGWAKVMPGLTFFPAQRDGPAVPTVFEATAIPDAGEPWERSVFVGFSDGSVRQIIDADELEQLVDAAGGREAAIEPRVVEEDEPDR